MALNKPTIVLAPGAWHSPNHYQQLKVLLEAAGHPFVCARLPSYDADDSQPYRDTQSIRDEVIIPLLNEGKDVVIMAHSYGGYPAGEASVGLSKSERAAKGTTGGVIGFIWITGLLAKKGPMLKERFPGGTWPPWMTVDENVGQFSPVNPRGLLYNDLPDDAAAAAMEELKPTACNTHYVPVGPPGWAEAVYAGCRVFLVCTEDQALPAALQKFLIDESGVDWKAVELKSGHSPFLSIPKETADAIVDAVKGFA